MSAPPNWPIESILRAYEDACAACITRYEGYVFQRLGDGIIAFFGYPLAHEGEAERAIHAGLEISVALSKLDVPDVGHLSVRIGIATGVVVVSSAEKGAVGEPLNLASRLQGIAQPGSILVSEWVQRLASGSFEYEDMGEQVLKGIAQPIRAYRVVGVSGATSRFEAATQKGLTPLVGREQELGLLLEHWALAQDREGRRRCRRERPDREGQTGWHVARESGPAQHGQPRLRAHRTCHCRARPAVGSRGYPRRKHLR